MKCLTRGLHRSNFSCHLQGAVQIVSLGYHQERQDKENTSENNHCSEIKSKFTVSWCIFLSKYFWNTRAFYFIFNRNIWHYQSTIFLTYSSFTFYMPIFLTNTLAFKQVLRSKIKKKNKTCINDRVFNHEHIVFYEYYNHRINKPTKKKQDTKRVLSFLTKL